MLQLVPGLEILELNPAEFLTFHLPTEAAQMIGLGIGLDASPQTRPMHITLYFTKSIACSYKKWRAILLHVADVEFVIRFGNTAHFSLKYSVIDSE